MATTLVELLLYKDAPEDSHARIETPELAVHNDG
jgi:hypothetical protein